MAHALFQNQTYSALSNLKCTIYEPSHVCDSMSRVLKNREEMVGCLFCFSSIHSTKCFSYNAHHVEKHATGFVA